MIIHFISILLYYHLCSYSISIVCFRDDIAIEIDLYDLCIKYDYRNDLYLYTIIYQDCIPLKRLVWNCGCSCCMLLTECSIICNHNIANTLNVKCKVYGITAIPFLSSNGYKGNLVSQQLHTQLNDMAQLCTTKMTHVCTVELFSH